MKSITIQDQHADLKTELHEKTQTYDNGISIIGPDGRSLFDIDLQEDGSIEISGGDICKVNGKILWGDFRVQPLSYNRIRLVKNERQ